MHINELIGVEENKIKKNSELALMLKKEYQDYSNCQLSGEQKDGLKRIKFRGSEYRKSNTACRKIKKMLICLGKKYNGNVSILDYHFRRDDKNVFVALALQNGSDVYLQGVFPIRGGTFDTGKSLVKVENACEALEKGKEWIEEEVHKRENDKKQIYFQRDLV